MTDRVSKFERSLIMKAVKSHGNVSTELRFIKIFKKFGIKGWRRKYKLFGNPDFVFPKERIVIFTDGCFWHGHNCRNIRPVANAEYWRKKISRNKKRDKIVTKTLSQKSWQVIRIWECKIKKNDLPKNLEFMSKDIKLKAKTERTITK